MQEETKSWLAYSKENLEAAIVLFESELIIPAFTIFNNLLKKH